MFFYEVEGCMQKLTSFGRVKKKWPKKSLTRLMQMPRQLQKKKLKLIFTVRSNLSTIATMESESAGHCRQVAVMGRWGVGTIQLSYKNKGEVLGHVPVLMVCSTITFFV